MLKLETNMKRLHPKLYQSLLYLLLPIILLIGNLMIISLNENFIINETHKFDVDKKIQGSDEMVKEIFRFFNGKEELSIKEFNEREITHMYDVKHLANITKIIFYILITLFFIFFILSGIQDLGMFLIKSSFFFWFIFYCIWGLFIKILQCLFYNIS